MAVGWQETVPGSDEAKSKDDGVEEVAEAEFEGGGAHDGSSIVRHGDGELLWGFGDGPFARFCFGRDDHFG